MEHKIIYIITFVVFIWGNSIGCYGQGFWDAWDKSASSVNHSAIESAIINAIDKQMEPSSRERSEDRREAERQNRLSNDLRRSSNVIGFINDPDYRSKILYESEFRERLKKELIESERITDYYKKDKGIREIIMSDYVLSQRMKEMMWKKREHILDYYNDPLLKDFIMSDQTLRKYYEVEAKIQDIKIHPENVLDYIEDYQVKESIKNNPELAEIFAEQVRKKAEAEQQAKQKRLLEQRAEEARRERERQAEQKRLREERIRALEQKEKNEQERKDARDLSNELTSMIVVVTRQDKEITMDGGISVNHESYDELLQDPTLMHAKLDCAVYNTKADLEKAWKNTRVASGVIVKDSYGRIKGNVVSIPTGKANKAIDRTLDMLNPGFSAKVRVISAERKEEENLVQDVMKCIANNGTRVSSSNNYRQYLENDRQFMECVNNARRDFVERQITHLEQLSHGPMTSMVKSIRIVYKWLTNIADNIRDETNKEDEEY